MNTMWITLLSDNREGHNYVYKYLLGVNTEKGSQWGSRVYDKE